MCICCYADQLLFMLCLLNYTTFDTNLCTSRCIQRVHRDGVCIVLWSSCFTLSRVYNCVYLCVCRQISSWTCLSVTLVSLIHKQLRQHGRHWSYLCTSGDWTFVCLQFRGHSASFIVTCYVLTVVGYYTTGQNSALWSTFVLGSITITTNLIKFWCELC